MPERVLPRDFPNTPELLIPLSNTELAELGTFGALWSQIDYMIFMLVAHLARVDFAVLQLMMENMTTGPRVGLLMKLCGMEPNANKTAIKKLCDENGGLIEDRNHIVHGVWAVEWNHETGATEAVCYYPKGKRNPIPATKLKELSNRAAKLSGAMGQLLEQINPIFAGERPRLMLLGKGDPDGHAPPPWPPTPPSQAS